MEPNSLNIYQKKTNVKKTKIKRENPFHILKTLEL